MLAVPILTMVLALFAAEEGIAQDDSLDLGTGVIEEIIVTARKRDESLQTLPISLSVFTADEIQKRGALDLRDVSSFAPSVAWVGPRQNAVPQLSIRGVQAQVRTNIGFESGIGVYVDGVVMGRSIGFAQEMFDVERVEFLRGPQGTLFGKNSIGGAISITTRNPPDTFEADAAIEFGEDNMFNVGAYLGGPLVEDTLHASISVSSRERDGIVDNEFSGNEVDTVDQISGRLKVVYTPSDDLGLTLSIDQLEDDGVSASGQALTGYGAVPGEYRTNVNLESLANRKVSGATLSVDYDASDRLTVKSITSYRKMERQGTADTDVGPTQVVDSFADRDLDQFSQEFQFIGDNGGAISYVAGLYYFNMDNFSDAQSCFGPFPPPFDFLSGLCGSTIGTIETTSYAAFANVDFEISDTFTLTTGLRWTEEEKELNYSQTGFPFVAPDLAPERDKKTEDDLSPLITGRWTVSDSSMIYATASRGFKSGGWNVDNVASFDITSFSQLQFDSESVWNYEVGFKSQFLDNRLRLNGSAYLMDYEDLQVTKLEEVLGGGGALVGVVSNAGEAEVTGVEIELVAAPLENLDLSAGLGYNVAEYEEYSDILGGQEVSFAGNKLDRAPELTANLGVQYTKPFDSVDLVFRTDFTFRDSYFIDRTNSPSLEIEDVSLVNLKIGLQSKNGRWDAFLFANNLLDERYFVSRGRGGFLFTGPSQVVLWGEPRTVWARLAFHY